MNPASTSTSSAGATASAPISGYYASDEEPTTIPMSLSRSKISELPSELLVAVFEAGACMTLQDDDGLPFPLLVSHVCGHWRAVACSASQVWAYVPVRASKSDMTRLFLERALDKPLDVCLHEEPDVARLDSAMSLIRSSAPRWINLYIRTKRRGFLRAVFLHFRQFPAMSLLRHFELQVVGVEREQGGNGWLYPIFKEDIFPDNQQTHWPRLERVVLVGASFGFWSFVFRGLKSLTLAHLSRMHVLTCMDFTEMMKMSPGLEHLKLVAVHPQVNELVASYRRITMPCLRVLELIFQHDDEYARIFFQALNAPALNQLSFESGWAATWDGFERAIPIIVGSYKQLRVLRLNITRSFTFSSPRVTLELFAGFPLLQEFTLNVLEDAQAQYFLQSWLLSVSDGTEVGQVHGTTSHKIWPNLELLTVRAPYDTDEDEETPLIGPTIDLIGYLRLLAGQQFDVFQEYIFSYWSMDDLDTT